MFTSTISRRFAAPRASLFRPIQSSYSRPLSTTPSVAARKGAEDKDSLEPRSTQVSQSGGDDASAQSDTAFDPDQTSPETQKKNAEKEKSGSENNPLDVSPGNKDVSKPRDNTEGGAGGSPRESASGGGSAPKSGGSNSG